MTCSGSRYCTWNMKPHGDSAVSVGICGHTVILSGILTTHSADLQGCVRQHFNPPCVGLNGTTRSVPCQVVAHGAFHFAGQQCHSPHRGSHIDRWPQDRRRLCLITTSNWGYQHSAKLCRKCSAKINVCVGVLYNFDVLNIHLRLSCLGLKSKPRCNCRCMCRWELNNGGGHTSHSQLG